MYDLKTKKILIVQDPTLKRYLSDIKHTVLTKEEEYALAERIKQGDERAVNELVKSNLLFVYLVAQRFINRGLPIHDLINEGNIGLIIAARKFDHTRGFRFISYAVWWIRSIIMESLNATGSLVKVSAQTTSHMKKIRDASRLLEQRFERTPDVSEVADAIGEDIAKVLHLIQTMGMTSEYTSLSYGFGEEKDVDIYIPISFGEDDPESLMIKKSRKQKILDHVDALIHENERLVVKEYFGLIDGEPKDIKEIGKITGLSTVQIQSLKQKALRRLWFKMHGREIYREFTGNKK